MRPSTVSAFLRIPYTSAVTSRTRYRLTSPRNKRYDDINRSINDHLQLPPELTSRLQFGPVLGCGRTAIVYELEQLGKENDMKLACKVFSSRRSSDDVMRELDVLKSLDQHHPHLPEFQGFYRSDRGLAVVMQRFVGSRRSTGSETGIQNPGHQHPPVRGSVA